MTDAQLSVLLYQYATRLSRMIDAAEQALPDETMVTTERHPIIPPVLFTPQTYCPALEELRAFAQELKQDSELLELTARGEKSTKPA
jgi:hypothetical protein